MAKKKNRQKQQVIQPQKDKGVNWDLVWKVLASVFAFAGSVATVYDLVDKVRSDAQTFYSFILPGLAIIVWVIVLGQLFRKKNPYMFLLLAVTVLGGVAGGIGWRSYNMAQEEKVIVLVAQFDGPEETYGLRDQIMEELHSTAKESNGIVITDGKEVVTAAQGSEYARKLGEKENADLVIWAWYRPTDNPNITIHFENLSTQITTYFDPSSTFQPVVALTDMESFSFQQKMGSETAALVNFLAGLVSYQTKDYSAALSLFDKSLKAFENSTSSSIVEEGRIYLSRGNTYASLKQYELAFIDYTKALQINPEDADTYYSRGAVYAELKQYDQAISDYTKSILLDPQGFEAYNNRGTTYANLSQYDQSIADYTMSIQLHPQNATAYTNRGIAYAEQKQYDQAIGDFKKALELDPKFTSAYNNRAFLYINLRQYDNAIADYTRVIKLDPQGAQAYISRGNVYYNLKQFKKAISDFTKAIQLDSQDIFAYNNRGLAYQNLEQYEQSIADFSKTIQLDPKLTEAYNNRGTTYAILEQYDLAITDCSKAIQLDSQFAIAYGNRSRAYRLLGKITEAESDVKKYEELTGQKP